MTLRKRSTQAPNDLRLRGCIGHLQPVPRPISQSISLLKATQKAALSAAFKDPRFPPVQEDELDQILVEVSVLTTPEEIVVEKRVTLPDHITIGVDGLIIEADSWHKGLLLPQVAPEQGWTAEEFLEGCCQKAGLQTRRYLDWDVRVYKFQAQIFAETSASGEIVERIL